MLIASLQKHKSAVKYFIKLTNQFLPGYLLQFYLCISDLIYNNKSQTPTVDRIKLFFTSHSTSASKDLWWGVLGI